MHEAIHYLVIDGVPSTDFGVYVTNSGAYTVPKKDYDLKAVSGRNGALYLDYGRMENVEIEYSGFIYENFQENFDGFMAFLMSRQGYFRLEDTVREDIYREAVFVGEVKPKVQPEGTMGTFEITFDCKPQKFLKSGEEPIEITDSYEFNTYINNPTRFPSSPLVQIYGYGELRLNDYKINIQNLTYGGINVADFVRETSSDDLYCYFKPWLYNTRDSAWIQAHWWVKFTVDDAVPSSITMETIESTAESTQQLWLDEDGVITVGVTLQQEYSSFLIGTTSSIEVLSTVRVNYTSEATTQRTYQDITVTLYIDIEEEYIRLHDLSLSGGAYVRETKQVDEIHCYSTASVLGNPLNVDMETGDAYKIENGVKTYVNNAVWVGEKLPVLAPGDNAIEQADTMSKVVIVPRWWTI